MDSVTYSPHPWGQSKTISTSPLPQCPPPHSPLSDDTSTQLQQKQTESPLTDSGSSQSETENSQSPVEVLGLVQVKDDFDNAKIEVELSSADTEVSQDKDVDQYEVQREVIFASYWFSHLSFIGLK